MNEKMDPAEARTNRAITPELYFLIAKFLSSGPCQEISQLLKRELERAEILPTRLDWLGNTHNQTFEELESKYAHIKPDHLLKICARIGPVLEKEIPPCVPGVNSLLGAGRQSLLRTAAEILHQRYGIGMYSGRWGGSPFLDPPNFKGTHNLVRVLQGRENSGPLRRNQAVQSSFYNRIQLYRHTLGHLSAVYCVLFDRTGRYIITGADDLLVKVWSSSDGRLLATFRGASAEIMDIAVNFDNTLLAAGSLDHILRVWCFQTMSPVAVLSGHSGMITSVNFCPIPCEGINYLVTTSSDGSIAFWPHTKKFGERVVFEPKPIQYHEKMRPGQAQMICASFSPGGAFLAAGSADHNVRVYVMLGEEGPRRVLEVEAHSDTVDSIQWAHSGLRFISGSKDGTANVWHFEQQQWINTRLVMSTKLPGETQPDDENNKKAKVLMVSWDRSDEWVVTSVNDCSLKVWNAKTGELMKVLRGHKDEVFVLESHPTDPRIILSAGHDGQLMIWDVLNPQPIACFQNFIEGQGNGAIFDAKWSPDGTMLVATDNHGHLLMYGLGSGVERLKIVPKELFFHTDYRPLIRDSNNYVLDEQTQTAPHLMPPPFLVDVDGNPYPPVLQRLVPGRENCRGEQLVPNIAVGVGGMQEVIEGLPQQEPRSDIDRLIEALAQRQNIHVNGDGDNQGRENNLDNAPIPQIASPRSSRPGLRRVGDVEGVRQSSGNWQRDNTTPWDKPILARPMNASVINFKRRQIQSMAESEMESWRREMKRRPQVSSNTQSPLNGVDSRPRNRNNRTARHGYRTRATRNGQDDNDYENDNPTSVSSASSNSAVSSAEDEISSDSSSSDPSSEYSDWIADHGLNLEPPKRSKRKPVKKRSVTPPSDSDRRRSQRPKKKKPVTVLPNGLSEVPEIYRPSEWLTETKPRKAPYYPQMGDEIVYFRQGHQLYLEAVKKKKVYELSPKCEPWSKTDIRDKEFVKVVGIKYEIRPPRLCCLKLAQMDEEGRLTGVNFTIKYHDMADVLDFLVLRQTFDAALARSWSVGDRFRCVIDDGWWMGEIQSQEPLDEAFSESYFACFKVRWDNGEYERMSPWDLEPIDENRLPVEVGGAVPVLAEEIQASLYQPQPEEWPLNDRERTCQRIIRGLDQVMSLAIAEPFLVPVDLNIYPTYAFVVEYPIDLNTIKARFENHFYRRITSAQFDVRYLATNAEKFNEPHSQIVKQARIVTDLCLKIIKETTELDVPAVYHQLVDNYQSSDSEIDPVVDEDQPSTSQQKPMTRRKTAQVISQDWKMACRHLLDNLWQCEDSLPFREPVDRLEHPDYYRLIDTPMDLRTVKEDLLGGNYETPSDFAKDMRLIFSNSRQYNVNKRSRIYAMTIRLSSMFEEHMKRIINGWKSFERSKRRAFTQNDRPKRIKTIPPRLTNGAGPSNSHFDTSDDEDENDDFNENKTEIVEPGPSRMTNGHSKRPSMPSRPNIRLRISRNSMGAQSSAQNVTEPSDSESEDSESSASVCAPRTTRSQTVNTSMNSSESEESYKPSTRGKMSRNSRTKGKNAKVSRAKTKTKQKNMSESDEFEEEETKNSFSSSSSSSESEDEDEVIGKKCTRSKETRRKVISSESEEKVAEEEEEEEEDDEEEEEVGQEEGDEEENEEVDGASNSSEDDCERRASTRRSTLTRRQGSDGAESSTRRTTKRPRYNEDSDASSGAPTRNSRRMVKRQCYAEDSDEDGQQPSRISVSSRGRVRKLTERALNFFK